MNSIFFGDDSSPLLGVHHSPSTRANGCTKSVLICPPFGQEYIRTHWALRLVANQLSRKGCHVLRFDYRGIGDSAGEPQDVISLDEWVADIELAIEHLKESSAADSVLLMGLRTGAGLVANVAKGRTDINAIVAWEPVLNGQQYLHVLRQTHQTMIDLWPSEVATVNDRSFEELLGTRYSRDLISEVEHWNVDFESLEIPQFVVQLGNGESTFARTNRGGSRQNIQGHGTQTADTMEAELPSPPWQKRVTVDDADSWGKLSDLEAAWLRPKTSQLIIQTIDEMFARLQQREMMMGAVV